MVCKNPWRNNTKKIHSLYDLIKYVRSISRGFVCLFVCLLKCCLCFGFFYVVCFLDKYC